ncbi:hypothetical protein Tco_0949698 [Tanacetum coccineum]
MCTYLKNMEGYKLKDLESKGFDSIQKMFDRAFKRVNTFEYFRIELVEGKEKRAGTELIQENTKKQKVEDNKEIAELKQLIKIIPDEEELAIDAIPWHQMLKSFDKEDLEDLYKLVKAKFESTKPVENLDLLLWGDLKTMFKPHLKEFDLLKLEILDENLSQEDVNQKLLRSLSPEWNTHDVVWRNKADLDTMSMDDLYNNLKV